MFRFLKRKLEAIFAAPDGNADRPPQLSGVLERDVGQLAGTLGQDLIVRRLELPTATKLPAALLYLDSLNQSHIIGELVLRPLLEAGERLAGIKPAEAVIEALGCSVIQVGDISYSGDVHSLQEEIVRGDCILLVNGSRRGMSLGTAAPERRSVDEPNTERAIRGPREGFTETLRTNVALIRRRLQDVHLTLEMMTIGVRTRTPVGIIYLRNLVEAELVQEVRERLSRISIDGILESGYIEQLIEDTPWSIFAQAGNTERPDVVAAKLLEGRVAILVDGAPIALTVPMFFIEGLQASEDYYTRPWYASIVRLIRFITLFISSAGPALYVALVSYHQELIPTPLLVTMAAAAEGTPFPAYIEAFAMGLIFEILREASLRLPQNVGEAVSIVGTLVIGQAAIQAGLFGAPLIIVVAITALSSFVPTPHADAAAVMRILFTAAAAVSGLFGMLIIALLVLIHLCALRSFGSPYFSPIAPFSASGQKDVFIRAPLRWMRRRPTALPATDQVRVGNRESKRGRDNG